MYEIEKIVPFSENANGTTAQWTIPPTSGCLYVTRVKGAQFGGHYHEGKSTSKNPETLFFIRGNMRMWISKPDGTQEEEVALNAPLVLRIFPGNLHRFEALEECAFLEFNTLDEHIADTKYPN